jgi:hypothetical protein
LLFREALRDNKEDFTVGPIRRAPALLAIPMMLEMAMESVFAVVDIAFVSESLLTVPDVLVFRRGNWKRYVA